VGRGINIILFGPPGAGKGTQAKRLQTELGLPVIASGDMFRTIGRENTPYAREIQAYMDRGEYVPDDLTIKLILDRLRQPDALRGFILDGFPRTGAQAAALDEHLAEDGRKVDVALHITAPQEVLERRIAGRMTCPICGRIYNVDTNPPKHDTVCDVHPDTQLIRRSDEEAETLKARLRTHERQTRPLIEYYRRRGNLVEIDGSRPMKDVEAEVDAALGLGAGTT
jgi:adenylate kinase